MSVGQQGDEGVILNGFGNLSNASSTTGLRPEEENALLHEEEEEICRSPPISSGKTEKYC